MYISLELFKCQLFSNLPSDFFVTRLFIQGWRYLMWKRIHCRHLDPWTVLFNQWSRVHRYLSTELVYKPTVKSSDGTSTNNFSILVLTGPYSLDNVTMTMFSIFCAHTQLVPRVFRWFYDFNEATVQHTAWGSAKLYKKLKSNLFWLRIWTI